MPVGEEFLFLYPNLRASAKDELNQDGTVKNDGSKTFTPDEVLRMDWLCDNVIGSIPQFDEIEPFAHSIVRQLGIYRDSIPMEKEGAL